MSEPKRPFITPIKNGPLVIENAPGIHTQDGVMDNAPKVSICRCGQSKNKPFCDGSHVAAGFNSDRDDNENDERLVFPGVPITIYENVAICSHAGFCPSGKPDKWRPKTAHGGFSDAELIKKIKQCPSGALSYADGDTEHRDQERPVKLSLTKDGPLAIEGGIELRNVTWGAGASREHYTLCRCGASKMKPFCDGAHDEVWANGEDGHKIKNEVIEAEPTELEPHVKTIHHMARNQFGDSDGPMTAMGVPRTELPLWDQIQIMTAQLDPKPLQEDIEVGTELVIGPKAKRPLRLNLPLFVSDMSFGALSEEVKIALAKGAEMAGTGICSGEGGMLPEEQANNSRYLFELGSGKHGYHDDLLSKVQAFHFKCGQAAKTGTGGHLPAEKVTEKIAEVRGIDAGSASVSPPTFKDLDSVDDFKRFADHVRALSDGIPVGFKLSANHIEKTLDFALAAGADYIILDGRGGGTGAAPALFRDHISVPTIPALARARRLLDDRGVSGDVTLIITGGLRTPADFVKALALGADGIALANASIQAAGCIGARICHTNHCPTGIATQDPKLRALINVDRASTQVANFYRNAVHMMQVMARACGHDHINQFNLEDLSTWHKSMAELSGVSYSGIS